MMWKHTENPLKVFPAAFSTLACSGLILLQLLKNKNYRFVCLSVFVRIYLCMCVCVCECI